MATVYLIPTVLYDDDAAFKTIEPYITEDVKKFTRYIIENERTSRRYLKKLWKVLLPGEDINIDSYTWHTIHKAEEAVMQYLIDDVNAGKTIGLLSEAGCDGIADPGQLLINNSQQMH